MHLPFSSHRHELVSVLFPDCPYHSDFLGRLHSRQDPRVDECLFRRYPLIGLFFFFFLSILFIRSWASTEKSSSPFFIIWGKFGLFGLNGRLPVNVRISEIPRSQMSTDWSYGSEFISSGEKEHFRAKILVTFFVLYEGSGKAEIG